jgi:DNA (cytosine-5)-methyltransferase 1
MNVLELFAGIGGLSLGLERAGLHVVGQVEIDPWCRRVLAKHWPEVPRHDDVRTALDWWRSERRPRVDVIAGGYPCQPESLAGRRAGKEDARWLWPEFAAIVARLRPRFVLGENVMGHRTRGLRFVLADLHRLGYAARAGIVAASEMGAPHQRKRIFVIAANVADTIGHIGYQWRTDHASEGARGRHTDRGGIGPDVADAAGEGWRTGRGGRAMEDGQSAEESGQSGAELVGSGWWTTEPDVGRVAYGVPGRVDRLRGLGNAVVPQVAEYVARLMLSGEWLD